MEDAADVAAEDADDNESAPAPLLPEVARFCFGVVVVVVVCLFADEDTVDEAMEEVMPSRTIMDAASARLFRAEGGVSWQSQVSLLLSV